MSKEKENNFIHIEFDGNQASYDLQIKSHNELISAVMGLEAYACKLLELDIGSVRAIIDEMKVGYQVKPPKATQKPEA